MFPASAYDFSKTIYGIRMRFLAGAPPVRTERWQGVPANTDTFELQNVVFEIDLRGNEDLAHWQKDIGPNLPWADDHFQERIGGHPLNPGEQWRHWPWGQSARNFVQSRFNHTYAERLWPKFARRTDDGVLPLQGSEKPELRGMPTKDLRPKMGIGWPLGDLQDWVEYLAEEPHNRQHCVGIWFPEDVGKGDGGRKPCTMYYQVMVRDGRLHMHYSMRSCDFRRHFRDDCYLAVRLLLWALERCRERRGSFWKDVTPGTYSMWITSLHIFKNDRDELRDKKW